MRRAVRERLNYGVKDEEDDRVLRVFHKSVSRLRCLALKIFLEASLISLHFERQRFPAENVTTLECINSFQTRSTDIKALTFL